MSRTRPAPTGSQIREMGGVTGSPLREMVAEFKVWVDRVPVEDLRRYIQDALWKHDEPFEVSSLVRAFLNEREGTVMVQGQGAAGRVKAVGLRRRQDDEWVENDANYREGRAPKRQPSVRSDPRRNDQLKRRSA